MIRARKAVFFSLSILMSIILLWIFIGRCRLQLPSTTTLDTVMVIPLLDKTFKVEDLVEETDNLTIDEENQQILFTIQEEVETAPIGDRLSVGGFGVETSVWFGNIRKDSLRLPLERIVLNNAMIKSGQLRFEIQNLRDVIIYLKFELPDFQNPNTGLIFADSIAVPPNTASYSVSYPFAGYTFSPPRWYGENYFRYSASFEGGFEGDRVQLSLDIENLVFSSISGWLDGFEIHFVSTDVGIDWPDELEGFKLGSAELELNLHFGNAIPIDFDLAIEALETTNNEYTTPIRIDTLIIPEPGDETYTIILSDVADFLNSQPRRIRISGYLKLGMGRDVVTIDDNTIVRGTIRFRAPLTLMIPSDTIETDIELVEIGDDIITLIRDHIQEVNIAADIDNHLPVSGEVSLYISEDRMDKTIYDDPDSVLVIGPIILSRGTLAGDPGVVVQPGNSHWEQTLTKEEDLVLFEEKKLHMGLRFIFRGTEGDFAKIRPTDYIHVKAQASVIVRTEISLENQE